MRQSYNHPTLSTNTSTRPIHEGHTIYPNTKRFKESKTPTKDHHTFRRRPYETTKRPSRHTLSANASTPPNRKYHSKLFYQYLPHPTTLSPPTKNTRKYPSPPRNYHATNIPLPYTTNQTRHPLPNNNKYATTNL